MGLLQYTSKEMFSSTELIRKSKSIYEKLKKKEIEKAIILRDGKPSFMLLDFKTYEIIMEEYLKMKGTTTLLEKKKEKPKTIKSKKSIQVEENIIIDKKVININEIKELESIEVNLKEDFKEDSKEEQKQQDSTKDNNNKRKTLASNQDALKEVLSSMGKDDNKDNELLKNGTIRQKLKEFWD